MLKNEITKAQRSVRTDAYQMSLGEIVSMYENDEIVIHPDFQRLFRWESGQKSRLIESILLGIPLPPIFVFERDDGNWELIDGLQRLSTILEFMGIRKDQDGNLCPPSILESTKYLPSLHNSVWMKSDLIPDVPVETQKELEKEYKLAIRRARIGVEILKRPSDVKTKFDLFQRLNAGGTQANSQELRNCIMIMVNPGFFQDVKKIAENENFLTVCGITDEQKERQRHLEFATRYLVMASIPYDGTLDVEDYMDAGIVELFSKAEIASNISAMTSTFDLLQSAVGSGALRRIENGRSSGKVGLVGLEGIAVGIGRNITAILDEKDPFEYITRKISEFWASPDAAGFSSLGLRGTTRLQRTLPFGERHFCP